MREEPSGLYFFSDVDRYGPLCYGLIVTSSEFLCCNFCYVVSRAVDAF